MRAHRVTSARPPLRCGLGLSRLNLGTAGDLAVPQQTDTERKRQQDERPVRYVQRFKDKAERTGHASANDGR